MAQGEYKKAIKATEQAITYLGEGSRTIRIAQCYAYLGEINTAQIILDRCLKNNNIIQNRPLDIAIAYIALKEYDNAFIWLEKII